DRLHLAELAADNDALADREMHLQPPHLEQGPGKAVGRGHAAWPSTAVRSSRRKHAENCPGAPAGARLGREAAQASTAKRQRGRNEQPWSSRVRSGGCPSIGSSRAWRGRSSRGTERSSAIV